MHSPANNQNFVSSVNSNLNHPCIDCPDFDGYNFKLNKNGDHSWTYLFLIMTTANGGSLVPKLVGNKAMMEATT